MKTLVIARHGNTFRPGETPTRVGSHTDLPLVEEQRGRAIGRYLKDKGIRPTRIHAAPLLRTLSTAALASEELGSLCAVMPDERFIEVYYGPDENKTEDVVEERLGIHCATSAGLDTTSMSSEELRARGKAIIDRWNSHAITPPGWEVDVELIRKNWQELCESIREEETLLCVSSNGTIRFAPHITGDYDSFCAQHDLKVATGAVSIFTSEDGGLSWQCQEWGIKAHKLYPAEQA